MKTELIWITPEAEKIIAYCARVSSPHQENKEYSKLLKYCINNKHWSIFEMASMCVEIETSRAISAQLLRHKSFSFQEFSQRYAETREIQELRFRRQDFKNRQNSIDDLTKEEEMAFQKEAYKLLNKIDVFYDFMLEKGIAKECARMILPMASTTKLYMSGSIRSWIHYLEVRTDKTTQLEHREIAESIKKIFKRQLPTISEALNF